MKGKTPPNRDIDVEGPNWTLIPGGATSIVSTGANPDAFCSGSLDAGHGTIYVLSNGASPDGGDNYIWEGDGQGNWCNLPGLASQLAVSSTGTLYAVNIAGQLYQWNGSGSWIGLAGSASAITVGSDGSLYALSNSNGSGDEPIWRYNGSSWTWVPGSGVAIAGVNDSSTYTTPGGSVGPNGFYILTSQGYIYWGAPDGSSYTGLPGQASAIIEIETNQNSQTGGGIYALGYPASSNGTPLYYYDLNTPGWSAQAGSGTSISSSSIATSTPWVSTLYLVGGSGAIYSSPITAIIGAVTPNPTSLNFVAVGASYAQNLDVSQTNFFGSYTEDNTCSGIVTVSATSNSGGAAVYKVTPVAAGTCQITITGGSSQQAVVDVTVTTTSIIINRGFAHER